MLPFALVSMVATTWFLWQRAPAVVPKYKRSAVFISGMATFIAAYRYIRIFSGTWAPPFAHYPLGSMCGPWVRQTMHP